MSLFLFMGCASELTTIDERKLIVKGSQKFKPKLFKYFGSEKPYTGEAINHFESGKKESAGPFQNGRKNGIWTYWHEPVIRKINVGRIESKRLYKFGMRKGISNFRKGLGGGLILMKRGRSFRPGYFEMKATRFLCGVSC